MSHLDAYKVSMYVNSQDDSEEEEDAREDDDEYTEEA